MSITIREYSKNDMFHLALVCDDEWSKDVTKIAISLKKYVEGGIERCYLAEENNSILGFIYGYALPNGLLLPQFLYIKPDYRKKGIGTKLLAYFEENSECSSSLIYYNQSLHNYYANRGYSTQAKLDTALKVINQVKKQSNEVAKETDDEISL